jgi:hypothetical protein
MTGGSFFLELPLLNSARFQLWVGDFAQTFATVVNMLVLDNGAFQTAKSFGGLPTWPRCYCRPPVPNSTPLNASGAI